MTDADAAARAREGVPVPREGVPVPREGALDSSEGAPVPREGAPVPHEGALDPSEGAPAPPQNAVRSELSDGEWHRLHPLSPLLRGGLTLLVILGIVVANLRDRLIGFFLPEGADWEAEGDPIEFVLQNDVLLPALLIVGGGLVLLIGLFWMAWRFHTFRITGDDVEVRSGVLFRTHRRAPLDRVQGVNLTRPALARLVGLAKLEVVGAGLDANVKLEYLSTASAETIRGDILRLASGLRAQDAAGRAAAAGGLSGRVTAGLNEIIEGVDEDDAEPASIVRVPMSRLILANLLSGSTIWFLAIVVAAVVGVIADPVWLVPALGASIPAAIGFGTYAVRQFVKTVRYSIAPTAAGVRLTFGLLTTVTETLPPGRIHAIDVRQPVLWRIGGWWRIRVNRLSGRSATDTSSTQFAEVLPIGTQDDVERVLRLLLPSVPVDAALVDAGLRGPRDGDGYTLSPRRARIFKPLSWRRNGFRLLPEALLMRTGRLWPKLTILPLPRLQSLRIDQGPLDRRLGLAGVTGHTVMGPVSGAVSGLDVHDALALWTSGAAAAVAAATTESAGADIPAPAAEGAPVSREGALMDHTPSPRTDAPTDPPRPGTAPGTAPGPDPRGGLT